MTAPTVPAQPPTAGVGDTLPPLTIEATPTFVVSTALATRDFQDVHHDRDLAHAKGSKDIFVNILTDTGLVGRYVAHWAGQRAQIRSITLRLGVPWYAYDTLTFAGTVTALEKGTATVDVVGTNSLGKHVTSTVVVTLDHTAVDHPGQEAVS
ncbi:MaoC family dehydratase [Williamsia sp. M5A3_1d]